ncbi:uncharacterized protein V1513DRAFT_443144 [Lipomyces chichibuensis]|uniref:uncharacterized protein n=1 Tax=Lipomyces chichibuensis TaxID=1546026 RepID=UPI003343D15D
MPDSPPASGSSAPLPERPCAEPATFVDFLNVLLWMLFTNLVFSLGPSVVRASDISEELVPLLVVFGVMAFVLSKFFEVLAVGGLLSCSPSLSGRTVITTFLLAAHFGLLAPMCMSNITLYERFTFMLWSATLGVFFGIFLAFRFGRSESSFKKGDRDLKED